MAGLNVAVLGAGNIGGTLGRKWAKAGNNVTFGVNDPNGPKAQAVRADLGDAAHIGTAAEALAAGNVVLLAVPGRAMDDAIRANKPQLDGKIIIDAANHIGDPQPNSLATLQAETPNAKTYRAFNTLGWENFADPVIDGVQADLFFCGPDGDARATVEQLIANVGLRPRLARRQRPDRHRRRAAAPRFALAIGQRKGRHLAFKMITQ